MTSGSSSSDWKITSPRCAGSSGERKIARQLGISPETVKTHLHHVFERGGVHGRMALLATHRDDAVAALAVAGSLTPI